MVNTEHRPAPAVDIIPSEELVQYIDPSLLTLNYNDIFIRTTIIFGSFSFFAFVFLCVLVTCNIFTSLRILGLKFKVFLSLSFVRGLYGLFAIVLGCYAIFQTTNLDRDVVFGTNATSQVAMLLTVGFFIFELSAVILSDIAFRTFSFMLLTHHGLALIAYTMAIILNANFCFGCKGLILEMSTPFSCLCYVLLKVNMEHSRLWKINQVILVHTFHLRNVVECHLWYIAYTNWQHIYNFMPSGIFFMLFANLTLITFIMTPYWGYKKTQQLFNPVDWNFQESRNTDHLANGSVKQIDQESKKDD
ncbi:unnamed protein product [Candidula unifasciata]|uniref:TLC domain-containing protein n=1 Tax=Candidula unifasciata TaxID=100452 RepID=A0A8S3ZUI4_9EUPU|nr:unnamed protein product [Candidula unifasciata]